MLLFFCPGLSAYAWASLELIALGLFAVAFVVGFLFGVPEYIKTAQLSGGGAASIQSRQILQPNSNISKVSDWLTTAITAVTLSQIVLVPGYILVFGRVLESAFQLPHYGTTLAIGLALYFPALGFIAGYTLTTLYLIRSINEAANSLIPPDVQGILRDAAPSNLPTDGTRQPSAIANEKSLGFSFLGAATNLGFARPSITAAIKSATSVSLSELSSPDDIAAWARAQALAGNWKEAVRGFQQAIALCPNDSDLLQNYANALYNSGADIQMVIDAYLKALMFLSDRSQRAAVLANIGLAYLYQSGGYDRAIEYLNQAITLDPSDARFYFYRACAYGQRWEALPEIQTEDRQEAAEMILEDTKKALSLDPQSRDLFVWVSDPNRAKDPQESDLEAFAAANNDFRELIGLPKGGGST